MPAKRKARSDVDSNEAGASSKKKGKAEDITVPAVNDSPIGDHDEGTNPQAKKSNTVLSKGIVSKNENPKATATTTASSKKAISKSNSAPEGSAAKVSSKGKAPAKTSKVKYSNADTLSNGTPKFVSMAWPIHDSDDEETDEESSSESSSESGKKPEKDKPESDLPCKVGEKLTEAMINKVSDMGYPISESGIEKLSWLDEEQVKRCPDDHDMYIYNDFAGYGMTEMFANFLKNFNKDLFKKDVSPYNKWAYVEGLATFLQGGSMCFWMMSDDPDAIETTINMFGTMLLTSLEMLSEHGLLKPYPPSPIPNIGIVCSLILQFAISDAGDFEFGWPCEIVRALDKAGIELQPRKQLSLERTMIDDLRQKYQFKENDCDYEGNVNAYQYYGKLSNWDPEDDEKDGSRLWARWDWKKEYVGFRGNYPGGTEYDITKMSKSEKAKYEFGSRDLMDW